MENKEVTNEMIKDAMICDTCRSCKMDVFGCEGNCIRNLAKALKEEREKMKENVWKNAPEDSKWADVTFRNEYRQRIRIGVQSYTRELPKSRIDLIAEKYASQNTITGDKEELVKQFKAAINEALEGR